MDQKPPSGDDDLIVGPLSDAVTLATLLADCTLANRPEPIEWGPDVGTEIVQ